MPGISEDQQAVPFTPKLTPREKDRVRYRDPTLSIWLTRIRLSSFQLITVAGAAVVAKTAVAPLERVKVRPLQRASASMLVHALQAGSSK